MALNDQVRREAAPADIGGWNWGAFGLTWIWGIGNRTPAAWLVLVPVIGWIGMPILLGFKGNTWAWRNGSWPTVDAFRRAQRKWAWGALFGWTGVIVATAVLYVGMTAMFEQSEPYQLAKTEITADPKLIEVLGQPIELGRPSGSMKSHGGGAGDAQLQFSLTGPKGKAKAYVTAQQSLGTWQLQGTAIDLEDGTRLERTPH
jgi:hypothetical protein